MGLAKLGTDPLVVDAAELDEDVTPNAENDGVLPAEVEALVVVVVGTVVDADTCANEKLVVGLCDEPADKTVVEGAEPLLLTADVDFPKAELVENELNKLVAVLAVAPEPKLDPNKPGPLEPVAAAGVEALEVVVVVAVVEAAFKFDDKPEDD